MAARRITGPAPHRRWRTAALIIGGVALHALRANDAGAQIRPGTAQGRSFGSAVIEPIERLPDSQVDAIVQTPDGYLWLGTRRGVVRFDGLAGTTFSPATDPALPSGEIIALMAEPTGRLWISTNRGLAVREGSTFRRIDSTQIPAALTWEVLRTRDGRIWVAGTFGVYVGDGTRFAKVRGADAYSYSLAETADGRVWMAGREFFGSIGRGDTAVVVAPFSAGERFFDVISDGARGLWVATRSGAWHLNVDNPRAIVITERVLTGTREATAEVWAMVRDREGDLWLGTQSRGVLRWDGQRLRSQESRETAFADAVWSLAVDSRGRVWAGTAAGLVRHQRSPFTTVSTGMRQRSTYAVRGDANGALWATTEIGLVLRLEGDRWQTVLTANQDWEAPNIWPSATGGMLIVNGAGRAWMGSATGARDISPQVGLDGLRAKAVLEDRDGSVWAATDSGLYHAVRGVATRVTIAGLNPRRGPRLIHRDARGRLLLGDPGLTIVDGPAVQHLGTAEGLTDVAVRAVYEDGDNLWVGTADSGLFVVRGNKAVHLAPFNERLRRDVLGIIADDDGYLWLTSRTGLFRVARRSLEAAANGKAGSVPVRSFDRGDGLPTTEFNGEYQSQLYKDARGGIWLPSYSGAVYLDPRGVRSDSLPPQVHVQRLVVDGTEVPLSGRVLLTAHPVRVDVTVAVTDALLPARARAEYRVIGVDSAWSPLGLRRTLSFGPLRGGNYRVEIRAAGEDGDWNPAVATVMLSVPLAWNEQWWFVPLLALLLTGALVQFVRWRLQLARAREAELEALVDRRTAQLEASKSRLEERVEERTADLSLELERRTRLEQRLATARKLESIGRLAGGVAHEINNALTIVLGFTQLAQRSAKDDPDLTEDLQEILRAGRRAADVTHQLLAFAKRQQTTLIHVSLDALLGDLERSLQQLVGDTVTVEVSVSEPVPAVLADPSQVEQLIVNLVKNAREAMAGRGAIRILLEGITLDAERTVGAHLLPRGSYVTLSVCDSGPGIAPEVLERLFEPFFTTKDFASGSGLGLAVCEGIVSAHHGAIDVESPPGEGACFRVWLPASEIAAPGAADAVARLDGSETLLVVEDEPAIRGLLVRTMQELGYQVLDADDGVSAMAMVEQHHTSIDLILTDVQMPRMNGGELATTVRDRYPDIPVVFISGYAGLEGVALESLQAIGPIIAKPFTIDTLVRAVRTALERRAAGTPP